MGRFSSQLQLFCILFKRQKSSLLLAVSLKWQRVRDKFQMIIERLFRLLLAHNNSKIHYFGSSGLKRYAYEIKFFDIEFLLKIFGVLGSGKLVFDLLAFKAEVSNIVFYWMLLVSVGIAFIILVYATIKQVRSWPHNVVEIEDSDKSEILNGNDLLTEKYVKNGYRTIREGITQKHYIMSDEVNRVLYEDRWHRYISCCEPFFLPEQCAYIAPYYLGKINRKKKSEGTYLYFNKLIGLLDDITSIEEDTQIRISKTNYFDFILTNESVKESYQPVIDSEREIIEGHKLLYNTNGTCETFRIHFVQMY